MSARTPRERLYEAFVGPSGQIQDKVTRALDVGTSYLDLPIGFFTHIDGQTQRIVCATGNHDRIRQDETCPLEDAYCRQTVERESPLAIQDVDTSPITDRAVRTFGLEAYLGTTVTVHSEVYGTVCFADDEQRGEPFSESEELFLELLARLIGGELERTEYEQDLEEQRSDLKREKQRFEAIAENSFDILFRLDTDTKITYVSSAVERVLGYQPQSVIGDRIDEYLTPSAATDAAAAVAAAYNGSDVEGLILEFLDESDAVVVLEVNATPVTTNGEVAGVQGVGRDVTARRKRRQELRMKTRAIDKATLGISIADLRQPDNPLVYVNDGFERITGYDAADAVGENFQFLRGDQTDSTSANAFQTAIEQGESTVVELINHHRDSTPFWNRVQLNPVFNDESELTHYLGFHQDVTEQVRTTKLVRLLNRVLRHNLRNDVTAIRGWGRLLQADSSESPADVGARIERISEDLVRVSEHAKTLRQQARRPREPQRLDTKCLVEDAVADTRSEFDVETVDVSVETTRDVCAGTEVKQAIAELVENGLKHSSNADPHVSVSATDDGAYVTIVVRDNGPGIEAMEAEVISTGQETAVEHGSGLGLWLVNWIVTRYGGSFQIKAVKTDEQTGTTATLKLPALADGTDVETAERGPAVLSL
ncbi:diguanylate cyclase [Haloferax sp. Atlit-4N]|uniref:PAS domain S-box protein n=1 Tax=unclassified Haloferax TaxID=2625095 RepID=UPI000E287484|nr:MULTISPECIES: PAS domain S-box protein [unclassified Haloferax]RDZ39514.1 diguanylate cyclase [Haloferax sp. Atlit-19N]RDZ50174.1 diguanylate cyclase [Haloferax sp. Atlit-4N]